jgi:hypothetical protein
MRRLVRDVAGKAALSMALAACAPGQADHPVETVQAKAASTPAQARQAALLQELGRIEIPPADVRGIRIDELSALAWDADAQLLYAVSDKGNVFHFRLTLDGDAIRAVEPLFAAALRDPNNPDARFNAEGLALQNAANGTARDALLVVALEDKAGPRIVRFAPSGELRDALPVPPPAHDIASYARKGRGLEAVAFHPRHGLVTAPESPLRTQPDGRHAVYAQSRHWSFQRHAPDSRLKALEVEDDGSLLVLERTGTGKQLTASLRRVADCEAAAPCSAQELLVLAPGANNFEGMTRLDERRVLLVSDHGGKKDPQTTTLVLVSSPPDAPR